MLDPLLRRFVETTDEDEAERELSGLIEQHALPMAKRIVGRKLRSYGGDRPGRSDVGDRDDVIADAMVTLVERLRTARAGADESPVESFVNYAAAVVHSACAHHIRRRYPERARLKDRLRYVCSTDNRLALWTSDEDDLDCGLAAWRGRSTEPAAERAMRDAVERGGQRWATMSRGELTAAIIDLLRSAGAAVEFEVLVRAIALKAGVAEPRMSGDPSALVSREPAQDVALDQRRFLAKVWDEIGTLSVRQRVALLLNLRDPASGGLLWLLPLAGIATVRQIARVLEIADAEFASLWQDLPLDDATIAERLGCARQQVINLRMAARKRLTNRLGGAAGLSAEGHGWRANLTRVSASLKGSA